MQLVNEFVVPRGIDETWAVLTDVERIAPAMPGAQLTGVEDGKYHGKVKVKVGPVTAAYAGVASFRELDAANHHMVLDAQGKESSGRGRASAVVSADLTQVSGTETKVAVTTDLTISGPLAQFGRGAIAEVSTRLLNQFVANLKQTVLVDTLAAGAQAPAASAPPPAAAPPQAAPSSAAPSSAAPSPAAPSPGTGTAGGAEPGAVPSGGGTPQSPGAAGLAPADMAGPEADMPGAACGPASASASSAPGGPIDGAQPGFVPPTPGPAAPPGPAGSSGAGAAAHPGPAGPAGSAGAAGSGPRPVARPASAPATEVNLLKVAAWPILKRLIPLVIVVVVVVVLIVVFV